LLIYDDVNLIARALREIHYYQSEKVAESVFLPKKTFALLVKELLQEEEKRRRATAMGPNPWPQMMIETDAVVALQLMSEHLLTDVFQMAYFNFLFWSSLM
jgi:histone H3/H4